jgi:hypothetical protein
MAKDSKNEARFGPASTHQADLGRVVVVERDTEHEGETYKAGTQDLPLEVADALIDKGAAHEAPGVKKGRPDVAY